MPAYQSPADQYYALRAQGLSDADIIAQYGLDSPVGRIIALQNRYNAATPNDAGYRYQYPTTPRRERSYAQSGAPAMVTDTAPLSVMPQAVPAQDAYYQEPVQQQAYTAPAPAPAPTPAPDPSRGLPQYASNPPMVERAMYSPQDTVPSYTGADRAMVSRYPVEQDMIDSYQRYTGASPNIMQAITDGLNSFRDPSAYAPDFGMLPDRAVVPQYPSLPSVDLNDVSGYAPTQEVLDMINGYRDSMIAQQQARDAAMASYSDPSAYVPSPNEIEAVQSVQQPQYPTGLYDTIMGYLSAPSQALYNFIRR